jgi:hypothetical protein
LHQPVDLGQFLLRKIVRRIDLCRPLEFCLGRGQIIQIKGPAALLEVFEGSGEASRSYPRRYSILAGSWIIACRVLLQGRPLIFVDFRLGALLECLPRGTTRGNQYR